MSHPEETSSEETPWYLIERPRRLASLLFAKEENVRVDDVSDLDVGVDLAVRSAHPEKEASWMFGVVTKGAVSLPESTEVVENGIWLPRSELSDVTFPDSDYPVLFAYCTMVDDATYVGLVDKQDDPITESEPDFLKNDPPVGFVDKTEQPVPLVHVSKQKRKRTLGLLRALARDVPVSHPNPNVTTGHSGNQRRLSDLLLRSTEGR